MNVVDYVIIGIIGISVLFGLYRGFISSVLNIGGGLVSFIASFWLYPKLAVLIQNNQELVRTLSHYTDASSRVGDLELAITNVIGLGQEGVRQVLEKVQLPAPLDTILQTNLENHVYASTGVETVAEYVSQTILQASINIICFLVCFAALYIVISVVLNLLRAVFRFPVLKQLDSLAGGVFGLLRGLLICLAVFTLIPLVQTMVPLDVINELLAGSALAPVFMNGNLITAIMNGRLF
ncbi:MAG: CvpA family protein [Clostridia bacterium]|nr:CvpA family protein [Clostridia bacterium]